MAVSSVFNLIFQATDRGSLGKMRNLIKGVGQESYKTFDALSRSMSKLEKSAGRAVGKLAMLAGGGGFMTMAFKGLNYSLIQSNSLIKTNTILLEEVIGNKGKARQMVSVIQEVAGTYGQDISELMTASRGVVQVMRQVDKGVNANQLDRMLKMIMTVSAMDTENRGLAFTAFSFKEAFQGIGQQDWKSMMNRLEINIGRTYQGAITNAIKKGNLEEAIALLEEGLANIGMDSSRIMGRLMAEGLTQNISRTVSYFNRFFQMIGEESFTSLARPFAKFNSYLSTIFSPDSEGYKAIYRMSATIEKRFMRPVVEYFYKIGDAFKLIGGGTIFSNFIKAIKGTVSIFSNLISIPLRFISGLFGMRSGVDSVKDSVIGLNKALEFMGKITEKISKWLSQFKTPMQDLGLAINDLLVTILKLFDMKAVGGTGNLLGSIIKNTMLVGQVGVQGVDKAIETLVNEKKTQYTEAGNVSSGGGFLNSLASGLFTGVSILSLLSMFRGGGFFRKGAGGVAGGVGGGAGTKGAGEFFQPLPYGIDKQIKYKGSIDTIAKQQNAAINANIADLQKSFGLQGKKFNEENIYNALLMKFYGSTSRVQKGSMGGAMLPIEDVALRNMAANYAKMDKSRMTDTSKVVKDYQKVPEMGSKTPTAKMGDVLNTVLFGAMGVSSIQQLTRGLGTHVSAGWGKVAGVGTKLLPVLSGFAPHITLVIGSFIALAGTLKYFQKKMEEEIDQSEQLIGQRRKERQTEVNLHNLYAKTGVNPQAFRESMKNLSTKNYGLKQGIFSDKESFESLMMAGIIGGDKGLSSQFSNFVNMGGFARLRKMGYSEERLKSSYGEDFYNMYSTEEFDPKKGIGKKVDLARGINVDIKSNRMSSKEAEQLLMDIVMGVHDKIKGQIDDSGTTPSISKAKSLVDLLNSGKMGSVTSEY